MAKSKAQQSFKYYTPQNGDNLEAIAKREASAGNKVSANEIADFNWGTHDATTVQEMLRDQLGCHKKDSSKNYVITDDCKSGVLKIPTKFKEDGKSTDTVYKIHVKKKKAPPTQFLACAKVKGVTFEKGKSFIRPSVVDDLKALENDLKKYPKAMVMIWGHCDADEKNADDSLYAKKLSERRAKSVYAFITNDVDAWESLYTEESWGPGAVTTILADLGYNLEDPNAQAAIKKYQTKKGLATKDGSPNAETRKALFKDYMTGKHDIKLDASRFMDPTTMGCSYYNPEGKESDINRRVMFYLFNKDRLPTLPCALADLAPCDKQMQAPKNRYSETYNCSFYDSVAKGCDKMAADAAKDLIWVYLKLLYIDPEDKKKTRAFPKDLPVKVVYKDKSTEDATTKDGGKLELLVPRAKQSFSLSFDSKSASYVVVEAKGDAESAELKAEADVEGVGGLVIKKKQRAFLLPSKWSTVVSDWTAETSALYKEGVFTPLSDAGESIGDKGNPVVLTLDPHWHYTRFEYFDRKYGWSKHGGERVAIPTVLVRGQRKVKLSAVSTSKAKSPDTACAWKVYTTGTSEFSSCQAVPWIVTKDAAKKNAALAALDKEMVLELGEKNLWVQSKSETERVLVELDAKGADKDKLKPGKDRPPYYDLPALWKSVNQAVHPLTDKPKWLSDLTSADIEASADPTKALVFSLDDIVLVNTKGRQDIKDRTKDGSDAGLSSDSRIAVLYLDSQDVSHKHRPKIWDPRAKAEYFSNLDFSRNAIISAPHDTRAVVFCSGFYDIYDKRAEATAGFKFANKHILGARAAMLNDSDVSGNKSIRGDAAANCTKGYAVKYAGNYDIHYLHYCGVDGTTVIGALVTHWSCRFKLGSGGTAAAKNNHVQIGMKNCMERWNGLPTDDKKYLVEKLSGSADVVIQPFMIFEAKQENRGGGHKCIITVLSIKRSNMGLDDAEWGPETYQPDSTTSPTSPDYDNTTADRFTAAHEMGHATGNYDDYIERLAKGSGASHVDFGVAEYSMWYWGMPYYPDANSIMNANFMPRMRFHWNRVNWLNDESKSGGSLNKFLEGNVFQITYDLASIGGTKLKFELTKDKYRRVFEPSYRTVDHSFGAGHTSDMCLFKLGEGEYAHVLPPMPSIVGFVIGAPPPAGKDFYNGVLVVQTFISVKFTTTSAAGAWTNDQMRDWMTDLQKEHSAMLKAKFRITGPAGSDFERTFVRLAIHFRIASPITVEGETYVVSGTTDYTLTVKKGDASFPAAATTSAITVGDGADKKQIVRYLRGQNSGSAALTKADLAGLATWMGAQLGGAFTVDDV
jgi:outer membrane protein OmpA-like peptidoglycan-associated protein